VGVAQLCGFLAGNGATTASGCVVTEDSDVGNLDADEGADTDVTAEVVVPATAPVDMLASSSNSVSPLPLLRPKIVGVARLLRTAAAARTSSRELFLSCLRILGRKRFILLGLLPLSMVPEIDCSGDVILLDPVGFLMGLVRARMFSFSMSSFMLVLRLFLSSSCRRRRALLLVPCSSSSSSWGLS